MPFFAVPFLFLATALFAVEQEQPTPYDLIRPIWPMTWDTAATDDGGTVESFSSFIPNKKKHNVLPKIKQPADFAPNGIIPDTLNQAFRDAQNLRIGRIRINQAGYLPEDTEKQFYYVSAGKCEETYTVVDLNGNEVAGPGKFTSTGKGTTSSWTIIAGTDAAQNDKERYKASTTGPEGTICVGKLADIGGLAPDTRYRVKVLKQYSSTFIISDKVYSMVRDATLKFYGINRSGNSESWFHKPSHVKDGAGSFVTGTDAVAGFTSQEGALQGGWYDCGDHLKESQTQAYAFMVLAVMAASNPDRDEDHYAYNMGETVNTDGVPDILREAKHGADFFMRAYRFADGIIDNMAVSVGNFGADHGWWGRPENQDALPTTLTGRGGPHERDIRLGELGSNISGQIAAGLAILSKDYATYDKAFADSCLIVAEKMYDFAKNLKLKEKSLGPGTYDGGKPYKYNTIADGWSSPAYNGNNESHDDLAIAAIALHYATYEKTGKMDYLNDAVEDKTIGVQQESTTGFFNGGWMAWNRDGMRKSSKNTSWANAYTYTLYGFYKMLLKDTETGMKFGIDDKTRLKYAENVALTLATNVSYLSKTGANSITIPTLNGPTPLSFGDLWYDMQTDQTWIYNRYQAGNIFEVLAYSDVTKDLEGKSLPQKGVQQWHSAEMKQLGINQLNYMLGVNPWDVSFLLGVGDKNDAHPHHRASNPEGKNMPGAGYKYNPPTGALFGGVTPDEFNVWKPSSLSWEDYHLSETCIDATAMFVASSAVAVREEDRSRAPEKVDVEIRYVGYDSAIVKITQDLRGPAMILYSTSETGPFNIPAKDTVNGVSHEIHLTGLENGTTYYFKVIAINIRSEAYTTRWLVDSTNTPYSFTTLVSPPGDADIQNVKVCNLSADSAEIMWYTPNGQYESKVYWDTTLVSYDQMTCPVSATGSCDIVGNADVSGIPTSFHYVKIGKLQEKTTYYYCVESNGSVRCKDDKGQPLKFTTPVTRYNFDVSVYQYEFGGMDFLNLNIVNNEDRQFDNLELRFYVTARPDEIEAVPGVNNQPGSCPLLVDSDICQAYDEAGFNKPCVNGNGENVDDSLRYYLRHAVPVKLEDTYNAGTGEYDWYIPIPLGGTMIKSSSRMRVDIGFSSGIYQNNMCETLRTPGKKRFQTEGLSKDWSWAAHTREKDGADYDGVPGWDKDQGDMEQAPKNPYIVIYRKGEFISGFSPSYQEMITKRANYEITAAFDAPFNVSNGSYVEIDSSISTMHLRGNAFITESGYVTAIWVNGVALTDDQLKSAAIYDEATGRYTLDIPAKMKIGTNKVDVTIFAGPNPECSECQENGGCAFVNRTYFVQFSKGDRTASALQLLNKDGSSVTSPAATDGSLQFTIQLKDKDNRGNSTVSAWVFNSRTGDSVEVTLKRTNEELGYFSSDLITAIAKDGKLPNLSFFGGDTIMVKYVDAEDEEDRDSVWFYAKPTKPIPQTAIIANDECTSTGTTLDIVFSGSLFNGSSIVLDSVKIDLDSASLAGATSVTLVPETVVTGAEVKFNVPDSIVTSANPKGTVTIYVRENGVASTSTVSVTDGILPKLSSFAILENENHAMPQDTLKIVFSEPVNLASKDVWPFTIYDGTAEIPQTSIKVVSATTNDNGKSWQYVIEGNNEGAFIKQDFLAEVMSNFKIYDMTSNPLSSKCGPVKVIEMVRPVPVQYARMSDFTGDGQPDEVYVEFIRKLRPKDTPDTIDVYWGNPTVLKSFAMPEGGWNLESIAFDTLQVVQTALDSANGTWIKGQAVTRCETKIENVCEIKRDTIPYTDEETGLVMDSIKETQSCYDKEVVDKTNCTTRQDSTFIPKVDTVGVTDSIVYHDVIRIAIPEGVFKNKTSGNEGKDKLGSYGLVQARQGPIDGGFSDSKYPLRDDCPPVIVSASWQGFEMGNDKQLDYLTVVMSEPLDSMATHPYQLERRREGVQGTYYSTLANPELKVNHAPLSSTTFRFSYDHEALEAFWLSDSVRLVPDAASSFYLDEAGLYPGAETPWVPVTGKIKKVKFKIEALDPLTTVNRENAYGGDLLAPDEQFRLSLQNKNDETQVIAAGASRLVDVAKAPIANYLYAGPVFKIDITLPDVLEKTELGEDKRHYFITMELDLFTNLGTYVNNTSYKFDLDRVKEYISGSSTLTLYLEWTAPQDYPVSADGKKIGTGPYIAKFNMKARGVYAAEKSDKGDDTRDIKGNDTFTRTFGFRRNKR
ncbi:MAG: glycoside hydrolase family 9 protein [Fibrobacter sp.]|nr:glycoside hydrolase family 9 protein [Fibrobacter sp.]